MSSPARYRPEIDGIRAIAVLSVIWFHAGLPGDLIDRYDLEPI